jgi:hypothetical protein
MEIIRDYWDKETTTQVVDLLKEYEDLFPKRVFEVKGIEGVGYVLYSLQD